MVVGVALIILDEMLKHKKCSFRTYVMPVAVGIYLPFGVAVPIFLGGLIALIVEKLALKHHKEAEKSLHKGTLFASGLVAGESIAGILIAIPISLKVGLPIAGPASDWVSLIVFAAISWTLYRVSFKKGRVNV